MGGVEASAGNSALSGPYNFASGPVLIPEGKTAFFDATSVTSGSTDLAQVNQVVVGCEYD